MLNSRTVQIFFQKSHRFSLFLIFSVSLFLSTLITGCGVVSRGLEHAQEATQHTGTIGRYGKLTPREMEWAKTAWRYVQNNTNSNSGLVNGSDRQPLFTIWQAGDYLAALVSAREIGLIDEQEFDFRRSCRDPAWEYRLQGCFPSYGLICIK